MLQALKKKNLTITQAEIDACANFYKGNVLVGSQDATLYCFGARTGKVIWKHQIEDQIRGSPTVVEDRCFVAGCDGKLHIIDLKTGKFKPEYAGKMNFYLAAVDDIKRHKDDQPSIGLILCRNKNEVVVEYSLGDFAKPLGVSEYTLTEALPENLRGSLPTVEELEAGLEEFPGSDSS